MILLRPGLVDPIRRRLAQYLLRAPFSLEKMSYDPVSSTVIYRSRMHKTLKRNYQIMPGADWLAQLCAHIPDRFEHLVRYAGWYSNRSRGKRRRAGIEPAEVALQLADVHESRRVRSTWARMIHKVYEVDPLECPRCKGPMRVMALIDDKAVIRKILSHLGLWSPQRSPRTQIGPPAHDPPEQSTPVLTYHPIWTPPSVQEAIVRRRQPEWEHFCEQSRIDFPIRYPLSKESRTRSRGAKYRSGAGKSKCRY